MNYFEKHIGDWIRDTVSLTMLEDGAYNRLIDQYYQTERALPIDKKLVYRLARANSSAERKAVDFVVENFFDKTEDGYVQKRAEVELTRYSEKRVKAQASANARWNRSDGNANASQTHDASDMRTHSVGNASQSPVTSHHNKTLGDSTSVGTPLACAKPGELSAAMRRHSIEAQPGDPRVVAAAEAGVSVETVEAACAEAKSAKPNQRVNAGYVLTIAERWTRDAATPRPPGMLARASPVDARSESRRHAYEVLTGKVPSHATAEPAESNIIDVQAQRIG